MGTCRPWPHTVLRIAIVLAAGSVVGAAAPRSSSVGAAQPPTCHSRSDCGPRVMGGLQITFTGWSCTTGFVARDTETRKVVVLTAGHCLAGSGLLALWSHHHAAVGRAYAEAFHTGSNADVGEIEVAASEAGNAVYGSSSTDIRSVTGWASNASQTGRFDGLPLGRDLRLALRIDRRRRCRCNHRWTAHSPHVVDRLSVGRRRQRLAATRPRWDGGRHCDRDHADAISVLDGRLDRHRASRSSLHHAGLRLNRCPGSAVRHPSP